MVKIIKRIVEMSLHTSKYCIKTKINNKYIVYSCMSGSIIELTLDKAISLFNEKFSCFSEDELLKLKKMGFITERSEIKDLKKLRNLVVDSRSKASLGLTILTTTACNANCSYCFEKGISKCSLNKTTADNIINFIKANYHEKPMHISWFGGEPLLNYKIITYICNKLIENKIAFNSSIITNGFLANYISADIYKKWNLKKVQITLDGIGEEYNSIKKFSGVENAFDTVVKNIKYLLSCGIKVSIRLNYNPETITTTLNTIDWIYQHFGSNNPLLYVYAVNIFDCNVTHVNQYKINKDNPYLLLVEKLLKYGYVKSLKQLGFTQKKVFCGIYYNYFVINANGDIYKCEHTCGKTENVLGNVNTSFNINKEKEKKWILTDLPSKRCINCNVLPCCQGNCKSLIESFGIKKTCLEIKKYGKRLLKMIYYKQGENLHENIS